MAIKWNDGKVGYQGLVVESNWDYAVVWDQEEKKFRPVAIYHHWFDGDSQQLGKAEVDALAELVEAYRKQKADEAARERALEEVKRELSLEKGKYIKVVKGRKVPIGTEGLCIWHGPGTWGMRVGLKTKEGEVFWTAESNVEVVL